MLKKFRDLSEREILALAISSEEEDGRIYGDFANALRESYPATAQMFEGMREEEAGHRDRLIEMFRQRFGEHIPLIRRDNVKGFLRRNPTWLVRPLGVNVARKQAEVMEMEAERFYQKAIARSTDASTRELLNKLADEERKHTQTAGNLEETLLTQSAKATEDASHKKLFLLQIVQPGLAGLMDGSGSTLAPLFAAAFATHNSSLSGSRNFDGIRRVSFRRRLADGTRVAVDPRSGYRIDDHGGRAGAHPAISTREFSRSDADCDCCCVRRTGRHRLHPAPLHGHAIFTGFVSGNRGRVPGLPDRLPDRQFVTAIHQTRRVA